MNNISLTRWISPLLYRPKTLLSLLAKGYFSKAKNYLLANINMVRKPEYAINYPTTIIIDPGNVCNLSCKFCITGQRKFLRPPMLLTFTNFKKIIDQLGKWAIQLDLYNWGEPFLNREIFKMIVYAKRFKLRVELSSNLNYFNPEMAVKLVESGLDRLIVSLHGATKATTQKYMRGCDFDNVIQNIKTLVTMKKEYKSKNPSLTWRYVVSRYNETELERAKTLSNELGFDYFEALPMKLELGFEPSNIKKGIKKHVQWFATNEKFRLYDMDKEILIEKMSDCYWPWEIVSINPDGGVQPCCAFANPAFDFGNVLKTPFAAIWNGEKYQTARRVIKQKIKTDQSTICGLCVAHNFIGK